MNNKKAMNKIRIKNSWKDVTIGEFIQIQALRPENFENEIDYQIELLAILSDKDKAFLYTIPAIQLPGLLAELRFLSHSPIGTLEKSYTINGKTYDALLNIKDLTAIQYIDIVSLLHNNEDNKNLATLLAVVLTESGKTYNSGDYDIYQVAQEIKEHFNMADAYTLTLFFSMVFNALIDSTHNYSVSKMKRALRNEKSPRKQEIIRKALQEVEAFPKDGAGFIASTWYLNEYVIPGKTHRI